MELLGKEASSINVGHQLKLMREERNISMRSLARDSGLSANALSMIERGLTSPSVSTLNKIANALGVPIAAFFHQTISKKKVVYLKSSERSRVPFLRGLWEGLGAEQFEGHIDAFLLTLEAGGNSGPHNMVHPGQEFVFCLRGSLEYEVDKDRYILEAGDTLLFLAQISHRWRNPGNTVANAIIIISGFLSDEKPSDFHLASLSMAEKNRIDDMDNENI